MIWLTHILSQADHRINRVQPWAERRLETLRGCSNASLEVRDLGDDRLADVLRHLSDDERWQAFEQELTGQLVRVSSACTPTACAWTLRPPAVMGSSTRTACCSWDTVRTTDRTWGKFEVMLATLDPLGMPLANEVLWGNAPMTRCICPPSHGCAPA